MDHISDLYYTPIFQEKPKKNQSKLQKITILSHVVNVYQWALSLNATYVMISNILILKTIHLSKSYKYIHHAMMWQSELYPSIIFVPTWAEIYCESHDSSIFSQSSNPVSGFSMMEQVRLCALWPMQNWRGLSLNQIQGWRTCLNMLLSWTSE